MLLRAIVFTRRSFVKPEINNFTEGFLRPSQYLVERRNRTLHRCAHPAVLLEVRTSKVNIHKYTIGTPIRNDVVESRKNAMYETGI